MPKAIITSHIPIPEEHIYQLSKLRKLSNLWDQAFGIPGTQWRMGLESLIGLLPIGGDWIGLLMSSYILFHAVKFNLPRSVMVRMVLNVLIDAIVGAVPILGDLFDTTWKANTKNVNLLEAHLKSPQTSHKADKLALWLLFGVCVLLILFLMGISVTLMIAIGKFIIHS
jgi:hypothetical protein